MRHKLSCTRAVLYIAAHSDGKLGRLHRYDLVGHLERCGRCLETFAWEALDRLRVDGTH